MLAAPQLQLLAEELGPDQAPMMWLGVVGGLRWAECAGLTVCSLDLLKSTVSVSQQLGRDGRLGPPKSHAGVRRLSLPDWLVAELASLLQRRGLTAANAAELVFVSPDGMPLNYTNWRQRAWTPACVREGYLRARSSRRSVYNETAYCRRPVEAAHWRPRGRRSSRPRSVAGGGVIGRSAGTPAR